MKAPRRYQRYEYPGGRWYWYLPDLEWLEDQYHAKEKSATGLAREIGITPSLLLKWLDRVGVTRRTLHQANRLNRPRGSDHPLWKGGW